MTSKAMIMPYFGDPPTWMRHWEANTERLQDHGYDFLHDSDEKAFQERVRDRLGIDCPPLWGTGRIWNYRPALGLLYADEIQEFDFWGHTDLDVVYGRVERWYTDDYLDELDVAACDTHRISGPWTLYRNIPEVNELFMKVEDWEGFLTRFEYQHGWAEKEFTQAVKQAAVDGSLTARFDDYQTADWDNFDNLRLYEDGRLLEGGTEVCLAHFRRTKEYPAGAIL